MKKVPFLAVIMISLMAISFFSACSKKSTPAPVKATLYDSLGGSTMVADPANPGMMIQKGRLGIRSVIDSTIFVIAADNRINGHFTVLLSEVTAGNLSGFAELSDNLTTFVAVATGSKSYTSAGMNMHDAHDPAVNNRMNGKATSADFDAFVDDLVKGANKNHLPSNLIASVGALVETLRSQVVQM